MKRQCLILLLLLLCGVGVVPVSYAQKLYTVEETPNVHLQDETQFVTDPAGVLSGEAKQNLNAAIVKVSKDYAVQIAIVILLGMDTSRYGSDREFSNRLFRHWGVGDKETNRGLLLLLFTHPDQRVINFEVGYGLEGDLPDALCRRIQEERMIPLMRDGNYVAGLEAGIQSVAEVLSKDSELIEEYKSEQEEDIWGVRFMAFLFWSGIFYFYYKSTIKLVRQTISQEPSYVDLVKLRFRPFSYWPTILWFVCLLFLLYRDFHFLLVIFYSMLYSIFPLAFMLVWFWRIKTRTHRKCVCRSCGRAGTTRYTSSETTAEPTKDIEGFNTHTFFCTACDYRHELKTPLTIADKKTFGKGYKNGLVNYRQMRFTSSRSGGSRSSRSGSWGGGSSGGGGASSRF